MFWYSHIRWCDNIRKNGVIEERMSVNRKEDAISDTKKSTVLGVRQEHHFCKIRTEILTDFKGNGKECSGTSLVKWVKYEGK